MSSPLARVGTNGLVQRPALMQRLEGGVVGPVTVVAASAGSGKTMLVRSWLESRPSAPRAAWVSVERGERDPQRFWNSVVTELRAAAPADVTIGPLAPTPRFDGEAVVKRLVSELAAGERRLPLVIDDLHEIASADVLDQLTYLLDHLPGGLHVVLIMRHDAQLGLHRRRLAGELTEVRSADLWFTLDETRAMLSAFGIALSEGSLELLHDRTEGWVAGLRLAALSLVGHPDPEQFVVQFSGSERTVAEYLLAEVLQRQTADVRRLLLRASLLDRVNGPLGDLLTGNSDSERQLQALAKAGAFVVALNSDRTWFRFHHLFADLLAVELRHTEAHEIPRLHLAAARWYAEQDHVVEAIAHFQAAGDRDEAAGLLIRHYFSLALDGRQATAHALLQAYAADSVGVSPEISAMLAADEFVAGSLDQGAAYLALAERHAESVPEHRRHRFDMAMLVNRLSLARRVGDFRSVLEEVQSTRILAEPQSSGDLSRHILVRALMLMNLGIVEVWSGHFDDGLQHLTAAREMAQQIGRPYVQMSCRVHCAQAMLWRSLPLAREASKEAIALAESHGWGSDPVIGPALVTLGTSLIQAGRLDEGEQWLVRADETLSAELEPAVGFQLHMTHGLVHIARGRPALAISSYRKAARLGLVLITGSPLAVQLRCSMLEARLGLGELDAVRDALAGMSESERDTGEAREVLAALASAQGDAEAAVEALAPTLSGSADVHHPVVVVRSLLREALARVALGELLAAEGAMERALELAEKDTLILPFLYLASRELLERHSRHGTAHGAFVAEILDVLSGGSLAPATAQLTAEVEDLSDAELRVLRYLPTNLSAADIANQIYVSVNTVKTHMRTIYAKLGAHSRSEVVQRAREVGLLGVRTQRHMSQPPNGRTPFH